MKITFTKIVNISDEYTPKPATQFLPEWYKKTPEYIDGERLIKNGNTPHTVKKCIPVFDALTAGYIIPTYVDIQVSELEEMPYYEWPVLDALSFHPIEQAPTHPYANGAPFPKWMNPWSIKTPRGYSCIFMPPMHNPNGIFTVLPGIVDTDSYDPPVNFPFVLNDVKWRGIIPAGTPMVQVIPFKRDSFEINIGNEKNLVNQFKTTVKLRSLWFNSYKRQFWSRKQFR